MVSEALAAIDDATAAMKSIDDLPDDAMVNISPRRGGFIVEILNREGTDFSSLDLSLVEVHRSTCGRNTYEVVDAISTTPGWGPFLYDLAMEQAYPKGLIPDRESVSRDAERVWEHYYHNRTDVDTEMLPSFEECEGPRDEDIFDYAYRKKPKLLPALKKAGRLMRGRKVR